MLGHRGPRRAVRLDRCVRARSRRDRVAARAATSSATTAEESEREAHASATSPSRSNGSVDELVGEPGDAPRPPVPRACARYGRRPSARSRSSRAGVSCNVGPARHPRSVAYPDEVARLRLAAAQLNLVVGDLDGNAERMLEAYERAEAAGCDLVAFPELAVTGYPPEDLLLRPAFVARRARRSTRSPPAPAAPRRSSASPRRLATSPTRRRCARTARAGRLPQAAAAELRGVRRAAVLRAVAPTTGRCSSSRRAGRRHRSARTRGARPVRSLTQAAGGAELVVNINASPYYAGRLARARDDARDARRRRRRCRSLYVNLVGGQDELVFDGASMVFDETRSPGRARQAVRRGPARRRPRRAARVPPPPARSARPRRTRRAARGRRSARPRLGERRAPARVEPLLPPVREVYEALVLGTRDYVRKNGFTDVRDRAVGRHRLVARRRDRGRRARAPSTSRRAHAVALLERRQRHRRRGARRQPRHPTVHRADRARARRVPRRCSRRRSRAPSPGWPRRTCRRASAATS